MAAHHILVCNVGVPARAIAAVGHGRLAINIYISNCGSKLRLYADRGVQPTCGNPCKDVAGSTGAIEGEWWNIDQKPIQKLIKPMPGRPHRMEANNGGRPKGCW